MVQDSIAKEKDLVYKKQPRSEMGLLGFDAVFLVYYAHRNFLMAEFVDFAIDKFSCSGMATAFGSHPDILVEYNGHG